MDRRDFVRLMAMAVPATLVADSVLGIEGGPEEVTRWSYDTEHGLIVTRDNVRNVIDVEYGGEGGVSRAVDPRSVARYGRRWMKVSLPEVNEVNARMIAEKWLEDLREPTVEEWIGH